MGGAWLGPQTGQQAWGQVLQQGQNRGQWQQELWVAQPQLPLLLSDHGFKSDRSTVLTSSSVSSMSERSRGSRYPHHGRCSCREPGGHMKINLPVFKDEDTKDAFTYQSWCWDLIVYHHTGCWDCTLFPYDIHSLQGKPGKLLRSLGTYITPDNVLTILDENYNNVKVLGALSQELFQLHMGEKETDSDWGVHLSRHLQVLTVSFLECFPPDHIAKLKPITFMADSLNGSRLWWPIWKLVPIRRHIPTIFEWQGRQRRWRWWNLPIVRLPTSQVSPREWVSFLYESWKAHSLPRPQP